MGAVAEIRVVKINLSPFFLFNLGVGITDQATNVFIIKGTKSPSIVPTNPNWSPK